ncbi:MAG: hypothetical protein GXP15_12405 [Gammaproteobacteria bacterium]|nr:hypothetical protein [Gammaproteobacteria bacterium]
MIQHVSLSTAPHLPTYILMLVGGGKIVTGWLRDTGIKGMRVDRTTATLFREISKLPAPKEKTNKLKKAHGEK